MRILTLLLSVIVLSSASLHKYYHSHCTFELNDKSGNGEVVIEVFSHDMEAALTRLNGGKKVSTEDKDFETSLSKYVTDHFVLKKEGAAEALKFDMLGSEVKKDQLLIYLEYKGLKAFDGLMLANSLLVSDFTTQVNKVNLKKGEWKKTLVFTAKNTKQKLNS